MNNDEEPTCYVSWYTCNCVEEFGFTSKYCDEYHGAGARIPLSVLESYR